MWLTGPPEPKAEHTLGRVHSPSCVHEGHSHDKILSRRLAGETNRYKHPGQGDRPMSPRQIQGLSSEDKVLGMAKPQAVGGGREEPEPKTSDGTITFFNSKSSRSFCGLFFFCLSLLSTWDQGQDFVFISRL